MLSFSVNNVGVSHYPEFFTQMKREVRSKRLKYHFDLG